VATEFLQIQKLMLNAQVGGNKTAQALFPPRLSCPWRASAPTAMVRSAVSVPTATIGAVRLVVPVHAPWASTAAVPSCAQILFPKLTLGWIGFWYRVINNQS